MDCPTDEELVNFFTHDREDFLSQEEIKAIECHILSKCAKCKERVDEYLKLFHQLTSDDFRKKVESERRLN